MREQLAFEQRILSSNDRESYPSKPEEEGEINDINYVNQRSHECKQIHARHSPVGEGQRLACKKTHRHMLAWPSCTGIVDR